MNNFTSDIRPPSDEAIVRARAGSASRSYWLYVWRGSKYRPGFPVEYSEPPQRFAAICDEEAAEIAAERAANDVTWELHDGNAMDANTKQIASKHRAPNLNRPNANPQASPETNG